ncbi:cysteine proteinase [Lepidopterella palustris CBS 459.81]|uniref:ubiquitinyl hydrolase 1 n=1 Tax=Lepidopterella palustris CBS 459.81 TaxID=1314670 RepID=A0A8E2EGX5_9PEZI|nr:cysteine proteinase [Lepidopterella palustris CBS 459.81]
MSGPAYTPTDEELAHLQKLSSEFEPEVTGPLVGERQSSSAITTEYANADPVYRVKTAALPSKYSHYRTCRGDGHCGWRAIAFTYFEALLRLGDRNRFLEEETRLRSMGNLLNSIGFQEHLYEDFADECFDLLRKTESLVSAGNDERAAAELLASFNDVGVSMAIITYFKLLTSAWIQTHPNDFAPFLDLGQDIRQYCSTQIEPSVCEIDHVGMSALAEVLVKQAGFALEVLYLDRSAGEEINTYRFDPVSNDGLPLHNPPTLRLLYRPGHYDILYKMEDVQQPAIPQAPLHVALADYADEFVPMPTSRGMSDVMSLIPGMYPTGLGQNWPSVSYDYNPSPIPQPQMAAVPTYTSVPVPTTSQEYVNTAHHNVPLESPVGMSLNPPMTIERGGPFRPSMYELEPGFQSNHSQSLPFQTSIFRNSHYNTAHFLNPDFQPEEWSPDSEYVTGSRSRHKSASQ